MARNGFFGVRAPNATAKYRAHDASMLRTVTEVPQNKLRLVYDMNKRHPWLGLRVPNQFHVGTQTQKIVDVLSEQKAHAAHEHANNMERLLSILRCPDTGEALVKLSNEVIATESGSRQWPIVHGRPVFTPEGNRVLLNPEGHLSNELATEAVRFIKQAGGLVLNLSAGGTAVRYPNVVEVEYSIFRHTDVVGDVHRLPFKDQVFESVICLNAFEHYREPEIAMDEIWRVLKTGGRLFLHTAFLQPLHEAPHHYYNCTEFGLRHWLRRFHVSTIRVSENLNPVYALSWLASELEFGFGQGVSAKAAKAFRDARVCEFVNFWRDKSSHTSPLWTAFYALPPNIQEKLAAGWEAIAEKRP
jgi:SAM-dependent methyltransferase